MTDILSCFHVSVNTLGWQVLSLKCCKLIFNFCCLLHVSNFLGSSSGRQLYMQYGMFDMHRCEQSGGKESVFETFYKMTVFNITKGLKTEFNLNYI